MPLINLIESQLIAVSKERQKVRVSKMILIGTSSIMGLIYVVVAGQALSLNLEVNTIEEKIKKLKPIIDQIDTLKAEHNTLAPKLQTLTDARNLTSKWAGLMDHLTRNTPPDVWLTQVRAVSTEPDKPIHVTFNGIGKTQTNASETLLRFQNSTVLESVNLGGTTEKLLEKNVGYEFEISADIVDTAEKKKDSEKKEGE